MKMSQVDPGHIPPRHLCGARANVIRPRRVVSLKALLGPAISWGGGVGSHDFSTPYLGDKLIPPEK